MKRHSTRLVFLLVAALAVSAFAQPAEKKVDLVKTDKSDLFVEGKTIISTVVFTGFDTDEDIYGFRSQDGLYPDDFLRYRVEKPSRIEDGEKFDRKKMDALLKSLKQWLLDEGYAKPEVTAYGSLVANDVMKLEFSLKRGTRLDLPEIRFTGNARVSEIELLDEFKSCAGDGWKQFTERKYEYYSQRCVRQFLASKGFLKAKVDGPKAKLIGNGYDVTFNVTEGPRYLIGDVKIEGGKVISNKEILEAMEQRPGDVFDVRHLQSFMYEELKRRYDELGHLQYVGEWEPGFVESKIKNVDGKVNLHIRVDEGRQFTLNKVAVTGIGDAEKTAVLADFPLKVGDVYWTKKVDTWITKLNESDRYSTIDKDNDFEILLNDENGKVDLVIKIKKIN